MTFLDPGVAAPAAPLGASFGDSVTAAVRAAPELYQAPGVAVAAAGAPGDPSGNATAAAQVGNTAASQQAFNEAGHHSGHPSLLHQTLGWFGHFFSTVAKGAMSAPQLGIGGADVVAARALPSHPLAPTDTPPAGISPGAGAAGLNTGNVLAGLNKPLAEVQHDYRYLRDVEASHGPIAALLEGVAIAGGAYLGSEVAGYQGAVLGGEAVASVAGRTVYTDSWDRTAAGRGYLDPSTHLPVSPGRDLAGLIAKIPGLESAKPGKGVNVVSGALDGLFDLTADPLAKTGQLAATGNSLAGAPGLANRIWSGLRFNSAGDVDRVFDSVGNGGVRAAFGNIAHLAATNTPSDAAAKIALAYPKFGPVADRLAEATDVEAVKQVFRDALDQKVANLPGTAPTLSPLRMVGQVAGNAVASYEGPGSSAVRALTTLVPTAWDPDLLRFSAREFTPGSGLEYDGIYRTARMGMSQHAAVGVLGDYIDAAKSGDYAHMRTIYKNLVVDMLKARGIADDSPFIQNVDNLFQGAAELSDAGPAATLGKASAFGADTAGRDLGPDAILEHQIGKWSFPDYTAVKRATQDASRIASKLGATDDFLYNHWTQPIFKPLALSTLGFAQRIAMSELIPNMLRLGSIDVLRSGIDSAVAKLRIDGLSIIPEEMPHIEAALYKIFASSDAPLGFLFNQDNVERLAEMGVSNGFHMVAPGVDATHGAIHEELDPVEKARRTLTHANAQVPRSQVYGDQWGLFSRTERDAINNRIAAQDWQNHLGWTAKDAGTQVGAVAMRDAYNAGATVEEATQAGVDATADWLRSQPQSYLSKYKNAQVPTSSATADPIIDFARLKMENLKGATHVLGTERAVDMDLLNTVADYRPGDPVPWSGSGPASIDSLNARDTQDWPLRVPGRELMPDTITNGVQRLTNVGFRRVINPTINFLSRQPIYATEYLRQLEPLEPLVTTGELSRADAVRMAQERAVKNMVPFIHNTLERSQFAVNARNWMPFWFAQEQAYKRAGRLLAEDPGAFRQYQLAASGLTTMGAQTKDANGNGYFQYPGSGFVTPAVVKGLGALGIPAIGSVPTTFSGRVSSLNTVFPMVDPSLRFGPVVTFPTHAIETLFPESRPAIDAVTGSQTSSSPLWTQLIPNTPLRNLFQAIGPNQDHSTAFNSAMLSTLQWMDYNGQLPDPSAGPDTASWQTFINRVKNQTRIMFLAKTLLSAITPASPVSNIGNVGLEREVRDLITKQGLSQGIATFLKAHPDATAYTVFQSQTKAGGWIPATAPGEDWINAHHDLLANPAYQYAGAWFVPQGTSADPYSSAVYNEQVAQGFRSRKTPDQFANDLYVAAGNAKFYGTKDQPGYYPLYQQALASAKGDPALTSQIHSNWSTFLQQFGMQNPVWYANLSSPQRTIERQKAIEQIRQVFADGAAPGGQQTDDLAGLLDAYNAYQNQLAVGRTDGYAVQTKTDMKAAWQKYLTDTVIPNHPDLIPVISKVFLYV